MLHDVGFVVESGSLMAILGASGGGKTTLLRLIAGFERPDGGEIRLQGTLLAGDGKFMPPEARKIGYVAQEGALFPHLSVADNITFGLKRAERRARHRVAELLEMVDLPAAMPIARRRHSPAASSSVWHWPARWRRARSWCCSMSRSQHWMPGCGRRRARRWRVRSGPPGRPRSS